MSSYSFPRPTFDTFAEFMGKERAEKFISEFEQAVNEQREQVQQQLDAGRKEQKILIKDELKNELVTRDIFEERFNRIDERFKTLEIKIKSVDDKADERFKRIDLKLNIFMALAFITLTFANPTFVDLIKHVIK